MLRKVIVALVILASLAGCANAGSQSTATPQPTATTYPTFTPAPTAANTAVPSPSATASPSATPAGAGQVSDVNVSADMYLDNRSDAVSLLASLFNAINRHEYLRAYSYWEANGQNGRLTFQQYTAGFANTASAALAVGQVTGGAAAGNLYYSVPAIVTATNTDGSVQVYTGCYLLHLGQPAIQGVPPFKPLAIEKGQLQLMPAGQDPAALVPDACAVVGIETGIALPPTPTFEPSDISTNRYLDDLSDPVQVLRSYYNAINRHEYLRAYSYWTKEAAAQQLKPYDQFAAGYADTAAVVLYTGTPTVDAGAGNRYYTVRVVIVATTASGETQTFAGCYSLHLGLPDIQATPPFVPVSIIKADLAQVDNASNIEQLLGESCP
ncbi:MAG: hypothetical protein ACYC6L_02830 [Anaerolineae bacterium]